MKKFLGHCMLSMLFFMLTIVNVSAVDTKYRDGRFVNNRQLMNSVFHYVYKLRSSDSDKVKQILKGKFVVNDEKVCYMLESDPKQFVKKIYVNVFVSDSNETRWNEVCIDIVPQFKETVFSCIKRIFYCQNWDESRYAYTCSHISHHLNSSYSARNKIDNLDENSLVNIQNYPTRFGNCPFANVQYFEIVPGEKILVCILK
jgi:hypothetical protein